MISAGIDLQPTTYELLHCLADDTGDLTQHDLQREMHCAKSTLSESVTTAARRGLIRRYVGADKRYRKVKLTNRGRVMLEEARRELKASVPAPR
jgi:DNA-binding MarR family transcriptional regulator